MTQHGDRQPKFVTVPYDALADDPALWYGMYASMTDYLRNEERNDGMFPSETVTGEIVMIVEKFAPESGQAVTQRMKDSDGNIYETDNTIAPRIRLVEKAKAPAPPAAIRKPITPPRAPTKTSIGDDAA
jgi:hypothetical protein